jgi:adenine deaminase
MPKRAAVLFACFSICLCSAAGQATRAADVMVVNAKVYTVNARQPWAEAIAIRGDKILAVGSSQDLCGYRRSATRIIDAQGRLFGRTFHA